jgi:hypothetical protein
MYSKLSISLVFCNINFTTKPIVQELTVQNYNKPFSIRNTYLSIRAHCLPINYKFVM